MQCLGVYYQLNTRFAFNSCLFSSSTMRGPGKAKLHIRLRTSAGRRAKARERPSRNWHSRIFRNV